MPLQDLVGLIQVSLQNRNIMTTIAIIIVLLVFQHLIDIHFLCPCKVQDNFWISLSAFVAVPFCVVAVMYLLYVRLKYCQGRQNGRSRLMTSDMIKLFILSLAPAYMWVFMMFLDGDYYACLMTDWDGEYACDRDLRPECLNWCKPKQNSGRNETVLREKTKDWIIHSKVIGYLLLYFMLVIIFFFILLYILYYMVTICFGMRHKREQRDGREALLEDEEN